MDEPTTRVVVHVTDDMREFLERLAVSQHFEKRAITKAIRFCIRQEMKHGFVRGLVSEKQTPAKIDFNL